MTSMLQQKLCPICQQPPPRNLYGPSPLEHLTNVWLSGVCACVCIHKLLSVWWCLYSYVDKCFAICDRAWKRISSWNNKGNLTNRMLIWVQTNKLWKKWNMFKWLWVLPCDHPTQVTQKYFSLTLSYLLCESPSEEGVKVLSIKPHKALKILSLVDLSFILLLCQLW